jgi:hypothetical protein
MPTPRETILTALPTLLQRCRPLPCAATSCPSGCRPRALLILRDGEPGEPEVPRYAMYSGCMLSWQMQRSGLLTATARPDLARDAARAHDACRG